MKRAKDVVATDIVARLKDGRYLWRYTLECGHTTSTLEEDRQSFQCDECEGGQFYYGGDGRNDPLRYETQWNENEPMVAPLKWQRGQR